MDFACTIFSTSCINTLFLVAGATDHTQQCPGILAGLGGSVCGAGDHPGLAPCEVSDVPAVLSFWSHHTLFLPYKQAYLFFWPQLRPFLLLEGTCSLLDPMIVLLRMGTGCCLFIVGCLASLAFYPSDNSSYSHDKQKCLWVLWNTLLGAKVTSIENHSRAVLAKLYCSP